MTPNSLSVRQVSRALGISRQRTHQFLQEGSLRGHKWDGIHVAIERQDFRDFAVSLIERRIA
jgi:excisionase family DNA binding protein